MLRHPERNPSPPEPAETDPEARRLAVRQAIALADLTRRPHVVCQSPGDRWSVWMLGEQIPSYLRQLTVAKPSPRTETHHTRGRAHGLAR